MRTEGSDPDGGDVPYPDVPSSLASTAVGEEVVVDRILPGRAQTRCREHGLQVGDRVLVSDAPGYVVGEFSVPDDIEERPVVFKEYKDDIIDLLD
jgi:hypothetical protein